QVITCQSAEEAIDKINEKSPDIILSDVAMPGKDGFELCREIKSNIQICHIPVILVTAKGTIDSQVEGLDMGADAYVTKPFDPSYLLALIRSQLENRRKIQGILNSAIEVGQFENAGELSSKDRAFMRQLYEIMNNELANEDLDITMLTDMMKISRTKFYYKIKSLTGKTPSEFFMQYKLNVAAQYLKEGRLNVSEIAIKTGFNTLQHFSKAFKNQFGVSPSRFK
ncbi:MAG: response regulator, partial [Bacteroidales bacterium]|nr:response regulator [Bacteroidales bacterium]